MKSKFLIIVLLISASVSLYAETVLAVRPLKAIIEIDTMPFTESTYRYDRRGNLINEKIFNRMNNITTSINYSYSSANRLQEITTYDGDELRSTEKLEYGDDGSLIRKTTFSHDAQITEYVLYECKDKTTVKEIYYSPDDKIFKYIILSYKDGIIDKIFYNKINEYTMDTKVSFNKKEMKIELPTIHSDYPGRVSITRVVKCEKGKISIESLNLILKE